MTQDDLGNGQLSAITLRRVVFGVGLSLDVSTVVATRVVRPVAQHLALISETSKKPRPTKKPPIEGG
jgi:hypothetical protein